MWAWNKHLDFKRLMRMAAVLTVAFSVLTAVNIPHHGVELFSHFRLQYLLASIVLIPLFSYWKSYVYVACLVVATAVNGSMVLPWYVGDRRMPAGAELKVIHANVHSSNTDYRRLIEFIDEEDPDLFVLQEMTTDWVAGTADLLIDYPYAYTESRRGNFGVAAFSKLPFDSITHIDTPPLGHPTIVATLTVNDELLTVISSHPTIPIGRFLYEARNEHMASVVELASNTRGKTILMGDFNASIWDSHFEALENQTRLKNVRHGFGILPSWPAFLPPAMIPIDHMLVSTDIGVLDARVGRRIGSDHLPLIVTLSL